VARVERQSDDVREAAGVHLRVAAIRGHTVDIGGADREGEAGELSRIPPAVVAVDHGGRHRLHRDGGAGRQAQEGRRGHLPRFEHGHGRDLAVGRDPEQGIRTRIGNHVMRRQGDDAIRVAVGTAGDGIVGRFESGNIGRLPLPIPALSTFRTCSSSDALAPRSLRGQRRPPARSPSCRCPRRQTKCLAARARRTRRPRPASVTNSWPLGTNAMPRGLLSPLAISSTWGAVCTAVAASSAQASVKRGPCMASSFFGLDRIGHRIGRPDDAYCSTMTII